MAKHYLYILGNDNLTQITQARAITKLGEALQLPASSDVNSLARGDLLLLAMNKNNASLALPPVVFKAEARREGAKFRQFNVQRVLLHSLPPINTLRSLVQRHQPKITFLKKGEMIALEEATAVDLLMAMQSGLVADENSDERNEVMKALDELLAPNSPQPETVWKELPVNHGPTEADFLQHLSRYVQARGYHFSEETLANYHISLKTRPLVILAGLSGTGKSKLAQLYAEALGCASGQSFLRLAVRPNWTDDRALLGYYNAIAQTWVAEPALDFLLRANQPEQAQQLHFLCLDEMNLAHIEYYFSQFLSALEEEQPGQRRIALYSQTLAQAEQAQAVPPTLTLPANLRFVGTINVDETTKNLSDKVIDRANTLEFYDVDFGKLPAPNLQAATPMPVSHSSYQRWCYQTGDESRRADLNDINNLLKPMRMGIGYRVLREVELYLANSAGLLPADVAFDIQVRQRILPRVRGNRHIEKPLDALLSYCENKQLTRSVEKLAEMKEGLDNDGFTSFFR